MKKDLGLIQAVYPMPVLMVAAYDENEKVNVMNVAWDRSATWIRSSFLSEREREPG